MGQLGRGHFDGPAEYSSSGIEHLMRLKIRLLRKWRMKREPAVALVNSLMHEYVPTMHCALILVSLKNKL